MRASEYKFFIGGNDERREWAGRGWGVGSRAAAFLLPIARALLAI
jgi:hypothetical protein